MSYPDKTIVIDTLLAAARDAALESTSQHPEDIAMAMSMATESAGKVLDILHKRGYLNRIATDSVEWVDSNELML